MTKATRQRIIETAEYLALTTGIAKVTTKEISRAAGIAEGTIYRHFTHKEEIFFLILERQLGMLDQQFIECPPGSQTVSHNLRALGIAIIGYYEHLLPLAASFFSDRDLLGSFRQQMQAAGGPEGLHRHIMGYIQAEQQLGRISSQVDALELAVTFLGPLFHYAFLRQLTGSDVFGLTAEAFVEQQMRGILGNALVEQEMGHAS